MDNNVKNSHSVDPSDNLDQKLNSLNGLIGSTTSSASDVAPKVAKPDVTGLKSSTSLIELNNLLAEAIKLNASDVHINVGYKVLARVSGNLKPISSEEMNEQRINMFVDGLLSTREDMQDRSILEFDLTYQVGIRRFRVNIFKQRGVYSIAFRIIAGRIATLEELGLPLIVKDFSRFANGLVLFTGPTGSGKSTTIASLLNLINISQPKHIITLEDPIEYVFPKGVGLVDQREYGVDFDSWPNALRSILRQDPDIVLIGEMRDLETVEAALQIAETGHLVFGTLHTNSAAGTIDRIIDIFPSGKQDQIKIQFASVIRAVVTQKLVRTIDERRRVAGEVLIANSAVRNAIRENKGHQVDNVIQTGSGQGMISLEKSLANLVAEGVITVETAKLNSNRPSEIDTLLNR